MVESVPNRTRTGLILLLIMVIILLVTISVDLLGRMKGFSEISEEEEGDYWKNHSNSAKGIYELSCMMSLYVGIAITILFIVGASIMFSARNSYGKVHTKRCIAAFALAISIPVFSVLFPFLFEIFNIKHLFIILSITISLFFTSLFLYNYEFVKSRLKFAPLVTGIVFSIPLMFIMKGFFDPYSADTSQLKTNFILIMVTDFGLIIAFVLMILVIRISLKYTKAVKPQDDNLQLQLLYQQRQQLKMEVEILKLQKEQISLLSENVPHMIVTNENVPQIETAEVEPLEEE